MLAQRSVMPSTDSPSLYGITEENSTRYGASLWGKNQFNSTFPLALCLYMRDHGLAPVAVIEQDGIITTDNGLWQMGDVIGESDSRYLFETAFSPYAACVRGVVDKIDLVVSLGGEPLHPLEVKLTVVPDIATASVAEDLWSPEMVMRPVSSAYAMMSVAANLTDGLTRQSVMTSLRTGYNRISDWGNTVEIIQNAEYLRSALDKALQMVAASRLQRPFLLQPLWRTVGQSFELADNCFDVFVWSDVAVMRLSVDQSDDATTVSRSMREVARHVRALYEVLSQGDYNYEGIYKGMALDNQTDKAYALSGRKSIRYLAHPYLRQPRLPRSILSSLILEGGERELKPERRFDAAVVAYMIQQAGSHS
ncbi:MAG: HindVP family restriction endonuclease [Acidimicrobiia bacterium]|nr:HindVP family restriction endonuclease [Acidimicrobiia bacterium]MYC58052.1 HindVP family restriction endonuclease [Acidimicrobiia bacterium]MYG93791.1 HindVP family restriction endonuclease [Acidimicrobiia bacterium]MYI30775.1 HindVP family restriction endonuclease [Acidimicrobiia bacterium]